MNRPIEMRALRCAVPAALLSLGGAWLTAQSIKAMSPADDAPVFTLEPTPEIANQGQEFFATSCPQCHGDEGHGNEGPDLRHLAISNMKIAATIKKGIKGEMPSFGRKFDDVQIAALVSYVRSLK